jgi:hypothetical protein
MCAVRNTLGPGHRFIREYHHREMKDWLASILLWPGAEDLIDRNVFEGSQDGTLRDIFDGHVLWDFRGPDGKIFLAPDGSGGHYVFSLVVDGFNPLTNKLSGRKISSTAIYMAFLNFPPEERYKLENMYLVGIVPGPHEPSLHQINHFLELLVDDLLELWESGVWFSSTPNYPNGRLVRCALVPVVCDTKAACAVSGFASASCNHFCSFCSLYGTRDINRTDYEQWPARSFATHKENVLKWKNARSESERKRLFEKHGVRWSVLLDLPYWNAVQFTVIDTMHVIFLGNLHRHCLEAWNMNIGLDDGDGTDPPPLPKTNEPPTVEEMVIVNFDLQ